MVETITFNNYAHSDLFSILYRSMFLLAEDKKTKGHKTSTCIVLTCLKGQRLLVKKVLPGNLQQYIPSEFKMTVRFISKNNDK